MNDLGIFPGIRKSITGKKNYHQFMKRIVLVLGRIPRIVIFPHPLNTPVRKIS